MRSEESILEHSAKQQIEKLIAEDKRDEAVAMISDLVEVAVNQKKFTEAERLREWIIETEPMALMTIVRTAEMIEEAKQAAITRELVLTWQPLVQALYPEEFSGLYHAMIQRHYTKGKTIVRQGEFLHALFFINSGCVQLFADVDGARAGLTKLTEGDIFGVNNYFNPSVWTISAGSYGAEIFALPYSRLRELRDKYPSLESKLSDYCSKIRRPDAHLKNSQKGRRKYPRCSLSGRTVIELLGESGKRTGHRTKGDLCDISSGGMSCNLRISKKENALKLFGKRIGTFLPAGADNKALSCSGRVVAVRGCYVAENEYSLHVKFDSALNSVAIQHVVAAVRP